jgi:uncharacterized repeat protein (TIGR01451 family)
VTFNTKRYRLAGRGRTLALALVTAAAVFSIQAGVVSATTKAHQGRAVTVRHSYKNDVSPALRQIPAVPFGRASRRQALPTRRTGLPHRATRDGARQTKRFGPRMPSPLLNFNGISYPGVNCQCAPPDPNGEVGLSQYVQIVNQGFEVFDKTTGASVFGPVDIGTLWSGFGGLCEFDGNGDPVVLYDQLANRWVVTQFAGYNTAGVVTDECIAVSRTSDASGAYNRYGFHLGDNFVDYPKLGVWPDAYYMSANMFDAETESYLGPQPFAFDRAAMLAGAPASFITTGVTGGELEDSYLPADLDGSTPPPAGAPNPFIEYPGSGSYKVYRFHVDWASPASSTFALAPGSPTAAGFTALCPGTWSCVPQLGVSGDDFLDGLGGLMMFRAAYRNFGDHESLVSNYSVDSSGVAGVRWFELRHVTSGTPTKQQESTYQPDSTWRWMGAAAMDNAGDLAVGYSASSAAIHPQIRYAGRLAGDPANTLGQGEAILAIGAGSQLETHNRWGDYSDMTVDPVDDCTFWYTNEYYSTTSSFNWRTRIGSFKFPSCTSPAGAHVTIAKSADDPAVFEGGQLGFTVELANVGADDATGLTVTDDLPSAGGVSWSIDATESDPGWSVSGSPPNQSLVYTPTTLAGGTATQAHVISGTTTDSCGGYDNTASFTTGNDGSGSAGASTLVECVTIAKTADSAFVPSGSQIGFTVTLHNAGTVAATGLTFADDLPSGNGVSWSLDSANSDSGWSVVGSPPDQSLTYTPTSLAGGVTTQAHIVSSTTNSSCGEYPNTAAYTTDNMGSDEAFDSTYVGCPDVAIYKYSDHDQVGAGNEIGFFVDLENFGDGPANQVTVSDPLPSGVGVSWSIDSGNSTSGWTISGTPPNQTLLYGPTSLSGNDLAYAHVVSGTTIESCGPYANTASFATANAGSGSASASASVVGCPPPFRTLSVTDAGSGEGTVTSVPAGMFCLPSCTVQFMDGTSVSLIATPAPGSRFSGWSGACSGNATCVIAMTEDRSVTATFSLPSRCVVPRVIGQTLAKARAKIVKAHCRVGKITRRASTSKKRGRVLAQRPRPGRHVSRGTRVNLTLGRGPAKT